MTFARCQEDAESVDSAHGKEIARLLEQERNFLLLTSVSYTHLVSVMIVAVVSALAGTWVYGLLRPRLPH